jgi:hypothetical protein
MHVLKGWGARKGVGNVLRGKIIDGKIPGPQVDAGRDVTLGGNPDIILRAGSPRLIFLGQAGIDDGFGNRMDQTAP